MASWTLAPSLRRFRNEINALWPKRDKRSDGDLGDTKHKYRESDHNPYAGFVHAIDVDKDGTDARAIVRAAIAHPATNYVIFDRTIWTRQSGFKPRRYTGANGHEAHVHISIRRLASARANTQGWFIMHRPRPTSQRPAPRPGPVPSSSPVLRLGMRGPKVADIQRALKKAGYRITEDGVFGLGTKQALMNFQRSKRLTPDGVCGPQTWAALRKVMHG